MKHRAGHLGITQSEVPRGVCTPAMLCSHTTGDLCGLSPQTAGSYCTTSFWPLSCVLSFSHEAIPEIPMQLVISVAQDKEFGGYPELQIELKARRNNEERSCPKMKRRDHYVVTAQWQSRCEALE